MFRFAAAFFFVFTMVLFPITVNAAEGEAQSAAMFTETATLIAEIPKDAVVVESSVRPRSTLGKMGYVYEGEGGFKVCMNQDCGPPVDRVAKNMPIVSPDGKHWAAIVQTGEKARVMLNGNMGRVFDMVYDLRFSPDSMKLGYIVKDGETYTVYVNQDRHRPFPFIDLRHGLLFSPDSKNLAYVASENRKTWRLVKNGKPGPAFEEIRHVTFSPDSNRLAYAARKGGKWHLVEGDQQSPGYLDIKRVRFGPNSENLVYVAYDDDGAIVVQNGEKSEVFDYLPGEPIFSPDGQRLAFAAAEQRHGNIRMRMVLDGDAGPAFDKIGAYSFSPDGSQFAYMAVDGEKGMIVQNGNAHEAYESIGRPVFSPEGGHLAYSAFKDGKWFVVKDGEKGPAFDTVQLAPVFGHSGEHLAYEAIQGTRYLVVEDGEVLGSYDLTAHLVFSPDGEHLAYTAAVDGMFFLVIDGQKGKEAFLSFLKDTPPVFTDDNTVQAIAARGYVDGRQEFWMIRAEIE